jgi:hypothetical protein
MPNLYITEFAQEGIDALGRIVPVAQLLPIAEQKVVFSTSTQSATLNANTTLVRLHADGICSVAAGLNPTATTSNMRLGLNQTEYFAVQQNCGLKIAAINNT